MAWVIGAPSEISSVLASYVMRLTLASGPAASGFRSDGHGPMISETISAGGQMVAYFSRPDPPPPMNSTLPRPDIAHLARYLVGITVVSVGAAFGIRSGLGAAPYDALLATVSDSFDVPFWAAAWALQGAWITMVLKMGGRFDLGTVLHSLTFGPIISLALLIVPAAPALWLSVVYLMAAVGGIAVGLWLYLGAGFFAGMVDTLFETVTAKRGWKPVAVRTTFDVGCCALAWLGSGPVGLGTVAVALGVGPLLGALDSGLLRPGSWRGIPLGGRRSVPVPVELELVDTAEYRILPT